LHIVGVYIIYINDARSKNYQIIGVIRSGRIRWDGRVEDICESRKCTWDIVRKRKMFMERARLKACG